MSNTICKNNLIDVVPVSFKEFAKDPVKAILFLAVVAIMYLYIDNKLVYMNQIEKQEIRIEKLEAQVTELQDKLITTINSVR